MILTDPNYNNDSSVNDQMLANEHARVTSHVRRTLAFQFNVDIRIIDFCCCY